MSRHSQETINKVLKLKKEGVSSRLIAEKVFGKKSSKSTVNDIWNRYKNKPEHIPKVLVLDIETAPIKAYVWSLWKNNVGLNQINSDWFILSYAAKWLGIDEIYYKDVRGKVQSEDDTELLDDLWKLLDEADVLLTQNGIDFDLPKIKARMLLNGYKPFSPVKHLDTLKIVKREFNLTSNKLKYMTDQLCEKHKKLSHENYSGFDLWAGMMRDEAAAFDECKEYNIADILSLEELYYKLAPWDSKHVNFNLYSEGVGHVCRCGSKNVVEDGYAYTGVSKFQQYRCIDCGATTRGRKNLFSKEKRKEIQMNISV